MKLLRAVQTMQDHHWWWRGLRALYSSALRQTLKTLPSTAQIIDVGCGYGANFKALEEFGAVVGVDASLATLRAIKRRPALGLVQANADALPFRTGTFDIVALLAVVEHVEQDDRALTHNDRVAR